jgi:hypothetical protein
VNHTIGFVNVHSEAHTNPFESTWQQVRALLNPCNRRGDYVCHLALNIFAAKCRSENVDQFKKFIGILTKLIGIFANMAWSATPTLHPGNVTQ